MGAYDLYVIFGQRKERFPGEYAPEALDVADWIAMEENPEWIQERLQHHKDTKEFESLEIVRIEVDLSDIMRRLRPNGSAISAKVRQ